MGEYEPLHWMGQTLGFLMMAAVMGAWRQAAKAASTFMSSKAGYRSIFAMMGLQAASRFALGLSPVIDPRIGEHLGFSWGGGPLFICSLALASASLCAVVPVMIGAAKVAGLGPRAGAGLSVSVWAAGVWGAAAAAGSAAGYADMCAAFGMWILVASLCSMIRGRRSKPSAIKASILMLAGVGSLFAIAGLEDGSASAWSSAGAVLGSLGALLALHARVHEITLGRAGGGRLSAVMNWLGAWALLFLVGPMVWRLSGSESGIFRDYAMMLGLLCSLFLVSWHFRRLNLSLARHVDDLGRDRARALLAGVDAAAFLVDEAGMVVESSKAAEALVGRKSSEMANAPVWEALGIKPIGKGRFEAIDAHGRELVLSYVDLGDEVQEGMSVLTARDVTMERRSQAALDRAAREDELTGLPNRREALAIVDQAMKESRGVQGMGLLFMDLDHFKNVNDTEGHAAGDALLREVAGILNETIKESGGWLARLGGDEFLGVIPGAGPEDCEEAAYRCIASMERSARALKGSVGVSVGVSLFPRDGDTGIDLIRRADAAMYEAKSGGRGRMSFFGESIEKKLRRRVRVEGFLREALKLDKGLAVALQPICLCDGTFSGEAEALIRAPGMEGLGAQELILVAERSGLILPLGRWVLRAAAQIQRDAQKAGVPLTLSINVSAKQFMDDLFWEQFRGMARLGQFARGITLEVTETTLMEDAARSSRLLAEARELGAKVALDDFGAGYSSLSALKTMPLDKLKLDKSLIDEVPEDFESKRVAQAAIAMASALGLEVVAEGVERPEQARWLAAMGVKKAQGYLFAKPMPPQVLMKIAGTSGAPVFMGEPK